MSRAPVDRARRAGRRAARRRRARTCCCWTCSQETGASIADHGLRRLSLRPPPGLRYPVGVGEHDLAQTTIRLVAPSLRPLTLDRDHRGPHVHPSPTAVTGGVRRPVAVARRLLGQRPGARRGGRAQGVSVAGGPAVGLTIPRTLITNDPDRARAFIDERGHERTIYKAFSATEQTGARPRLLRRGRAGPARQRPLRAGHLPGVHPGPGRSAITIIGDEIFAGAIHSQATAYTVDFRMDMASARIEAARPPAGSTGAARADGPARPGLWRRRHAADARWPARLPGGQHGRPVPLRRGRLGPADHREGDRRLAPRQRARTRSSTDGPSK